jgi:hypothetical protein
VAHYYNTVQSSRGPAVKDASISVFDEGTSNLSSIFTNAALTVAKANPFLSNASGEIDFYVAAGTYDIKIEKAGITTKNILDIEIVGGGAAERIVETPTGDLDGANKVFTLSEVPATGTLVVILNGITLQSGTDAADPFPAAYVLSGSTVTLTNGMTAPDSANGDWIKCEFSTQ